MFYCHPEVGIPEHLSQKDPEGSSTPRVVSSMQLGADWFRGLLEKDLEARWDLRQKICWLISDVFHGCRCVMWRWHHWSTCPQPSPDLAYGWETEATFPWSQRRQCTVGTDLPSQGSVPIWRWVISSFLGRHSFSASIVCGSGFQKSRHSEWTEEPVEAAPASAIAPAKSRGILRLRGLPPPWRCLLSRRFRSCLRGEVCRQQVSDTPPSCTHHAGSLRPNRAAPPMLQANVSRRCWQGSQNKKNGKYTEMHTPLRKV